MRFHDKVGFASTVKTVDGVWSDVITERTLYGDVLSVTRSLEESDQVNDNIRLQQRISVVADAFATQNFSNIKYVLWMGTRWRVNNVDVNPPRLILWLGGVYHGPVPTD